MTSRLTTILELLRSANKKVGKTFIQKAVYILQEWLDGDSDYKFKLHYYGPFSATLSDELDYLVELGLIELLFNGRNYEISINAEGMRFLDEHLESYMPNKMKIDRAIALIGTKDVKNMELLGTILYFAKLSNVEDEITQLVNTVKPHFDEDQIYGAIAHLKEQKILRN